MKSVLVLYTSVRGHTARIARRICDSVAAAGGRADMMDVNEAVHEGVDSDFTAFGDKYTNDFLPKYEAKFGSDPLSIFHAHAYDAMNIVFAALEKVTVKDADGTLHIPRQALRDAMYATKDFPGLTGTLTCSQYGDCGAPVIAAYKYSAGKYPPEKVWP